MRVAYLLLGVLISMFSVSSVAVRIVDKITADYERDISIYTLVGFYEGYQRGRDLTARYLGWQLNSCINDLNRVGRGKK